MKPNSVQLTVKRRTKDRLQIMQADHIPTQRPQSEGIGKRFLKAALFPVIAFGLALTTLGGGAQADNLFDYFWKQKNLETVTDGITKRYDDIAHIDTDQLAKDVADGKDVIIVDVREPSEYQVSHLAGAIRAAPNAEMSQVRAMLGPDLKGKTVVFYCSVGERSSSMARDMKQSLMSQGASNVYNLKGGIFAWHNEKRHLINTNGTTDYVHPFDSQWGRLVDRQALTRMELPISKPDSAQTDQNKP